MAISSDSKSRRVAMEEHARRMAKEAIRGSIQGVPFVEDHNSNGEDRQRTDAEKHAAMFAQIQRAADEQPRVTPFPLSSSKEDWVTLTVNNLQAKCDRLSRESALTFGASLVSLILNVVILAKHFAH
jgi:hypothetical protein